MEIYKKCIAENYSFLVNDMKLQSDNPLHLQKKNLKWIYKIRTIYSQIKDKKLQYNINREAAKTLALLSGKIDKYEYFAGGELLSPNQKQIIEQPKFTYSPLKDFWKTDSKNSR